MLVSVAYANPFADVKAKQKSSQTTNSFNNIKEGEVKTRNPFKTTLEVKEEMSEGMSKDISLTVNSSTVLIITLIITRIMAAITLVVVARIMAVTASAVVALIICAIIAKNTGGFANAVKESFLKVFLITLVMLILKI